MNNTYKKYDILMDIAHQEKTIFTKHEIQTLVNGLKTHDIHQ